MRSGLLTAIALALAGVAEVQWAIAFYQVGDLFPALMVLIAGIGMGLAAFGFYEDAQGRPAATSAGIALAAAAHVLYVAFYWESIKDPGLNTLAAISAAIGLVVATLGARRAPDGLTLVRAGLAIAVLGGILWIAGDTQQGEYAFMFGNVMAPVGWGLAALFAGKADDDED